MFDNTNFYICFQGEKMYLNSFHIFVCGEITILKMCAHKCDHISGPLIVHQHLSGLLIQADGRHVVALRKISCKLPEQEQGAEFGFSSFPRLP